MNSLTQPEPESHYADNHPYVAGVTHEPTDGSGYKRTLRYRAWRTRAATALLEAGETEAANLFHTCAEHPCRKIPSHRRDLHPDASTVWVCTHEKSHDAALFFPTCDLRVCPDCAARHVARFAKRYIPEVLKRAKGQGRYRLRHIVLTTPLELTNPHCHDLLVAFWNAVGKLWAELQKQNGRYQTLGTIESAEFGTDGKRLHFHVIHYGTYLPQNVIVDTWRELTGGECQITHVSAIGQASGQSDEDIANGVIETLKYSVKFWKRDKAGNIEYLDPELIPVLHSVLKGTRRVRSRGVFYNIPEAPHAPLSCDDCGHEMARVGIENWQVWIETGYLPDEWRKVRDGNELHLILANKSGLDPPDGDNERQPGQLKLFDFAPVATSHYKHD